MTSLVFLAILLVSTPQTAPLDSLRATLRGLHEQVDEHRSTFGATEALTDAKHQLRDWIESRLDDVGEDAQPRALAESLNEELTRADLFCMDFRIECATNLMGYVDGIRVGFDGGFLTIVTAMGIGCGYDESAYVYQWDGSGWSRVWESEQNTYTQDDYRPQIVHDIQISPPEGAGDRVILTLGSQGSCSGGFKDLYIRAWLMDSEGQTRPVLDWREFANDGYPPIWGRVGPDDVTVQFTAGGIAAGEPHTAVRHFRIEDREAVQVDPIALRPRDFVVEWLAASWEESRTRSDSASLGALEEWHAQLHREDGFGDFPEPALACTAGPNLWQVGTNFYDGPKRYYKLRWSEPYAFRMVAVSEMPYPDCTVADARGEAYPELFGGETD